MHGSAQPTIRRNATSYQHPTRHPTCADAHLPNTSRLRPSLCGRYSASWPPRALHPRSPTPPHSARSHYSATLKHRAISQHNTLPTNVRHKATYVRIHFQHLTYAHGSVSVSTLHYAHGNTGSSPRCQSTC